MNLKISLHFLHQPCPEWIFWRSFFKLFLAAKDPVWQLCRLASQREGRKRDFETGSRIPPRRIGHDIWRGKPSYDMGRVNSKLVFQKKTFFRFKIHTNMVNKVSLSQNYVSFEQLWKIICKYVTYFWLKRICRRIYFIYHLYVKNWKQNTFGNNYYPLCTSLHTIAQFPPPGVVTDPSGRTSAD